MGFDYEKMKQEEADGLRRAAFFGIAISTVATLTAIIAVPMLYNYAQHIQSSLQGEVDFCKHRTDGLWHEYSAVEDAAGIPSRTKRAVRTRVTGRTIRRPARARAAPSFNGLSGPGFSGGECCSCGVGPPGPPGPPGPDGMPGK
ncbi:unnamed protein product [Anisakis simplex]|uniref:Col_cuticle_N domain-containing protein n=1 Tax=Anisakis simplex TaxID=6269 RepID=A0A0M3K913_ANISI|nr:unnamed protein product [Anisakis simplex]